MATLTIPKGGPFPGGWCEKAEFGGGSSWIGQAYWSTLHGEAVLEWHLGEMHGARNCRLPDGSRGTAHPSFEGRRLYRMERLAALPFRRSLDRGWAYGALAVSDGDIAFRDDPSLAPSFHPQEGLEIDMAGNAQLLARCLDDDFADRLVAALQHTDWEDASGRIWESSHRGAGRLVAGMRNIGEQYVDLMSPDADGVSHDVLEALGSIGWSPA